MQDNINVAKRKWMGKGYHNNCLVKDGLVPCDHVLEFNVQNCLQDHLVSNLKIFFTLISCSNNFLIIV